MSFVDDNRLTTFRRGIIAAGMRLSVDTAQIGETLVHRPHRVSRRSRITASHIWIAFVDCRADLLLLRRRTVLGNARQGRSGVTFILDRISSKFSNQFKPTTRGSL